VRGSWLLQAGALIAAVAWIAMDPAAEWAIARFAAEGARPLVAAHETTNYFGWLRIGMLAALIGVAVGSLAWRVMLLLRCSASRHRHRHRSLQSMLLLTAVCADWCGVFANASSLAWQGKRARLMWTVDRLQPIAERLHRQWPERDGQADDIGSFMAYPFGDPSVLLLMQPPSVGRNQVHVSAIQRSESGAILFQLGGTACDDWAEWHPRASRPESFVGGLNDPHELSEYAWLGNGWYLARYET